jgi:predicted RNA-binding protein
MCEANVYINREGREEILMEKVDRIIPGEDNNIFLESIFGERKIVQARIREMELVHHRVVLEEVKQEIITPDKEIWLEPETDHGHFHEGEEVRLKVFQGYNMRAEGKPACPELKAFAVVDGEARQIDIAEKEDCGEINLGSEVDGLVQVYVRESGKIDNYAKIVVEVGHHHHRGLQAIGLPLEIIPCDYSHARMGESYEVQVLKEGKPLPGVLVRATFAGTHNRDYPHKLNTNDEGKVKIFLTARGNYLFSVNDGEIRSTYTLMKSF